MLALATGNTPLAIRDANPGFEWLVPNCCLPNFIILFVLPNLPLGCSSIIYAELLRNSTTNYTSFLKKVKWDSEV
jgi:hypothetical protein